MHRSIIWGVLLIVSAARIARGDPQTATRQNQPARPAAATQPTTGPSETPTQKAASQATSRPTTPQQRKSAGDEDSPEEQAGQHSHVHQHRHTHPHAAATHHAASEDPPGYQATVYGHRAMTAASATVIRDRDFQLRPMRRPADILQVTPGLFVVQHAGGGKANQYFLRGFDVDHGTDLAISVDGVPVNMVSHGHGQGYADLNWLIPETVRRIEVNKGPYFVRHGDFATAGALNLVTYPSYKLNTVKVGGGMFNTLRGVASVGHKGSDWQPMLAAEYYTTDGPFDNRERLQRFNLFGKVTRRLAAGHSLFLATTAYGSDWRASGQIPSREVSAGRLDRFGSIDNNEGGSAQRFSVYGGYGGVIGDGTASLSAYFVRSSLNLYSNFTLFSRNTDRGDMIEQGDDRTLLGASGEYRFLKHWRKIAFDTAVGVQARSDTIAATLYDAPARERDRAVVDADILQTNLAWYAREGVRWAPWLKTIAGVRGDYFGFRVDDQLEDLSTRTTKTSGVRRALRLSPKASVVLTPHPSTDIYLNFGVGFHSNDARGVVRRLDPASPLTTAIGYEVGARTRLFSRLDIALAFFGLHLASETVWVGDEGTTEPSGATRRLGLEGEARLELLKWLFADVDVSVIWPTFVDAPAGERDIPLAPRLLVTGGISARHPWGLFGRAGFVYLGDRPATEDAYLTAEGFFRLDVTLGYRHKRFALELSLQNATNSKWREAQFATVSRLPTETALASCPPGTRAVGNASSFAGCEDVNFTPGWPINLQASASLFF
ncbi:MAG: TonB-dependent receptor plug domain-containing protein [Deltaproteobacteria bacterium]|nr:TonB-dependent receptor plug domain-containing protein [Deltaproteobacteria bacterium]